MPENKINPPEKSDLNKFFGSIAKRYELINHVLSFGLDFSWTKDLVQHMENIPDGPVCDLAAGTGVITREINRVLPYQKVLSLDLCPNMLKKLNQREDAVKSDYKAVAGDVFSLPIKSASMSAVVVAFGIRNMRPFSEALKEINRILMPEGKLFILEFTSAKEKKIFGLYNFYLTKILPIIGSIISGNKPAYTYLSHSIQEFPSFQSFSQELIEAGFSRIKIFKKSLGIVAIYDAYKA